MRFKVTFEFFGEQFEYDYDVRNTPIKTSEADMRMKLANPDEKLNRAKMDVVQQVLDEYPAATNIEISASDKKTKSKTSNVRVPQNNQAIKLDSMAVINLGLLFAPIVLTLSMFGVVFKGMFDNVRDRAEFKSFRRAFLICAYAWFFLCIWAFIDLSYLSKEPMWVILIPIISFFAGNAAMLFIAIMWAKKISYISANQQEMISPEPAAQEEISETHNIANSNQELSDYEKFLAELHADDDEFLENETEEKNDSEPEVTLPQKRHKLLIILSAIILSIILGCFFIPLRIYTHNYAIIGYLFAIELLFFVTLVFLIVSLSKKTTRKTFIVFSSIGLITMLADILYVITTVVVCLIQKEYIRGPFWHSYVCFILVMLYGVCLSYSLDIKKQ